MLKWAILIAHRSSSAMLSHFQLRLQNRLMDFAEVLFAP